MDRVQIERAVDQIIMDLTDRRGLREPWRQIDADVLAEIRESWASIIARNDERGE